MSNGSLSTLSAACALAFCFCAVKFPLDEECLRCECFVLCSVVADGLMSTAGG